MTTNFPSSIDNFTNPTTSDTLASVSHSAQHADVNDAVEAIETALLDGAPLHIDDANERVGIGTTTPDRGLHVDSPTAAVSAKFTSQHPTLGLIEVEGGASTATAQVGVDGDDIVFRPLQTERMRIDSSGNVGIGTTTPEVPLHVEGGTDAALTAGSGYLQVGETSGDNIVIDGNEILARTNGGTDTLFMQAEGNYVYIGSNVTGTRSTESLRIQSGIRGQLPSANGGNQLIHLYNNVNIGYPSGWGGQDAPNYGLSVYGAIDSGNPIISGQMGTAMTHPTGDTILLFDEFWENQGGITYSAGVFTVPIAGKYRITLNPFMHTNSGNFRVLIGINNAAPYITSHYGHCYAVSGSGYDTLCLDSVVDLTANSNIRFRLYSGQIYNSSTDRFNQFSIAKIA